MIMINSSYLITRGSIDTVRLAICLQRKLFNLRMIRQFPVLGTTEVEDGGGLFRSPAISATNVLHSQIHNALESPRESLGDETNFPCVGVSDNVTGLAIVRCMPIFHSFYACKIAAKLHDTVK